MDKRFLNVLLWVITGVLLLVTLYPLTNIFAITGDDLENFLGVNFSKWYDSALLYAEGTGRFNFLLVKWVYSIPYLFDSELYYYSVAITPVAIAFALFIWLACRIMKNGYVALLVGLLGCATFSIFGEYSAMNSYPLYFSLSIILLLLSLHFLVSYFETLKYVFVLVSALLILTSAIFYECYLIYYLLIFVLIIRRYKFSEIMHRVNIIRITKEIAPYFVMASVYLIVYITYYSLHPTGYAGNRIDSGLSISKMWDVIYTLSVNSFPLSAFFNYEDFLKDYSLMVSSSGSYFVDTLRLISISAYFKGMIVLVLWIIISQDIPRGYKVKALVCTILIAVLFIILPHLPLAITEKYTTYFLKTYITTSFAFFAVIVFFIGLYLLLLRLSVVNWVRQTIIVIFAVGLGTVTTINQYVNERIADDMNHSFYRFELMKSMFTDDNITDNSHVFLAPLHQTGTYFCKGATYQNNPFRDYVKKQNNVVLNQYMDYDSFYQKFKNSEEKVYVTYYAQAAQMGDAILVLASCRGVDLNQNYRNNVSDSLLVGYVSSQKKASVSLTSKESTNVYLSGQSLDRIGNSSFVNLVFDGKSKDCVFMMVGKDIYPMSLMISNVPYVGTRYQEIEVNN